MLYRFYIPTDLFNEEGLRSKWSKYLIKAAKGFTILDPVAGVWNTEWEEMTPIQVYTEDRKVLNKILQFALRYFDQEEIFCFKVSDEVIIQKRRK